MCLCVILCVYVNFKCVSQFEHFYLYHVYCGISLAMGELGPWFMHHWKA